MDFNVLLALMVEKKASDLFITAERTPTLKVDGSLIPATGMPLTADQALVMVLSVMDQRQRDEFEKTKE